MLKNWRVQIAIGAVLFIIVFAIAFRVYHSNILVHPVIKSMGDIESDTKVSITNLKPDEVSGTLPDDVVTNISEINGMYSKGFIPGDTVLRKSFFKPVGSYGVEGELGNYPGCRAVAFAADIYTTVGGNISKGSVVTVSIVNKQDKVSSLLGENITVLSVNMDKSVTLALTNGQISKYAESLSKNCTFVFALQPRS